MDSPDSASDVADMKQAAMDPKHALANTKVGRITESAAGVVLVNLIKEYLEYYELDYTMSVFCAEAGLVRASPFSRPFSFFMCFARSCSC
jgi:hypothetical protein